MRSALRPSPLLLAGALSLGALSLGAFACSKSESSETGTDTIDTASAAQVQKTKNASVVTKGSKVTFEMKAPIEHIFGDASDSIRGDLTIDVTDLTKTRGLIEVDLDQLVLTQKKKKDGEWDKEAVKEDDQNQHARAWLQINEGNPKRESNRFVKFQIKSVKVTDGQADLTKMSGAERKVHAKVEGDFLLHGYKSAKTLKLNGTFTFDGKELTKAHFKTSEPFSVDLEEHKVQPRDTVGTILKQLSELANKVSKNVEISLEFGVSPTEPTSP